MSLRYRPAAGPEAEFQPGSRGRVLRNLAGITRVREMDRAESELLVDAQGKYYHICTPDTRFRAQLIRTMHRDWLGTLYQWAGEYRTVEVQKGTMVWPPAHRIRDNMAAFERGLLAEHTPCRPAPIGELARRLAG